MNRQYEVIEHDGCQWVRRIGEDYPTLFFRGVDEETVDLANKAAGLLGIKLAYERKNRYARAQAQMELVKELPGVEIFKRDE